jgi:C_GCAxxG_C_C family probable redox protein
MDKSEQAIATFNQGYNCSQSVLSAFSLEYGLDHLMAFKIGSAFGGGMGRQGATCGAVTGAFMVMGLKYGMTFAEDRKSIEKTYELVNEFTAKFKERHGSVICRDLLGCDISNRENLLQARKQGLFQNLCPAYVKTAVEILEEIL